MKNISARYLVFMILLFMASFVIQPFCVCSAAVNPDYSRELLLQEQKNLTYNFLEHIEKIHEYSLERIDLKGEQEWLSVKIQGIKDQKRTVPVVLENAYKRNNERIAFLTGELKKLEPLRDSRLVDIKKLDARVKNKYGNPSPEWWAWNSRVVPYLYDESVNGRNGAASFASSSDGVEKGVTVNVKRRDAESEASGTESVFFRSFEKKVKDVSMDSWLELVPDGEDIRLDVQLPILFGSGKADVADEYRRFLNKLSELIKPYAITVEVAGYPDSDTTDRKNFVTNMAIGTRRAASVVRELMNSGLPASSFKIISQGGVDHTAAETGFNNDPALMRRVDVQVFIRNPEKA